MKTAIIGYIGFMASFPRPNIVKATSAFGFPVMGGCPCCS